MYQDDVSPTWFFPSNIYNLVFTDKTFFQISKILSTWAFVAPVLTKFWDFAAGMDFDT